MRGAGRAAEAVAAEETCGGPARGRTARRGRALGAVLGIALVAATPARAITFVELPTFYGTLTLRLYDATQPLTVANFLAYVRSGRYDGTFFHRRVQGFVLQGGGFHSPSVPIVYPAPAPPMLDPLGLPDTGPFPNRALAALSFPTDPPVLNEPGRSNLRGTVAMAKVGGNPNSATNQFFVNLSDTNAPNLDNQNGGFTVFAEVIAGMEFADNQLATSTGGTGSAGIYNVAGDQIDNLAYFNSGGAVVVGPADGRRDPIGTFSSVPLVNLGAIGFDALTITTAVERAGPADRDHELAISSRDPALALAVGGTLSAQLTALNAGPPPFASSGPWTAVLRRATHTLGFVDSDCAVATPPVASRPYLEAQQFVFADEVTRDGCGSGFYRFTFDLPAAFANPVLVGFANVDDEGVVFLNGHAVSALLVDPGCNPAPGVANDPCYAQQDRGKDRLDAQSRPVLTAPTIDRFDATNAAFFQAGTNELVFAVAGDAELLDPTGLAFRAIVGWDDPDTDGDGVVDAQDNCPFAANANQLDRGGVGSGATADGVGDACQCGDVTGDGLVTVADALVITRSLLQPPTATRTKPELCDVGGAPSPATQNCTLADAVTIRRALLAPPTATISPACAPANP
jgi:cyclophilin family peptidyl-prolyl cis-trans isomerase